MKLTCLCILQHVKKYEIVLNNNKYGVNIMCKIIVLAHESLRFVSNSQVKLCLQ